MSKKKKPLLSDEYLDELAKEINQLYGVPEEQKKETNEEKE
ncbi:bacitracin ABC transporter ATP-binding protein [Neobacillus vireti]